MRVLMLSDDPDDETVGAAKAPHKLQAALRELGHGCDLLYSGDLGGWPRGERSRFPISAVLAWRAAARTWRRKGPYDVIDAAGGEGWLIALARRRRALGFFKSPRSLPGRGGVRTIGARPPALIARTHGLEPIYYHELLQDHRAGLLHKPWWRRCWYPATRLTQVKLNFCLADRAIVLNQRERAWIVAHGWQPPERVDAIGHGIEPARWAAAPPSEAARGGGALFSGAWYTGKGNAYLAEAHRILLARGIPVPLTILGPGIGVSFERIERHVRASFTAASQPWLTILPRLRDEDAVYEQYRRHDFLVCPSTAEGFGMVVSEALSQRLPVICSRAVGAADELRHGVDAWIVPPRDAAALAEAMAALWRDAGLRRRLAEAGYRRVAAWTWRRAAERTLCCYRAALGETSAAGAGAPGCVK